MKKASELLLVVYYLQPLSVQGELLNKSITDLTVNYGNTFVPAFSIWKFSPGVTTVPTSVGFWVTDSQNMIIYPIPDGNYTIAYDNSVVVSGYPATLTVTSGEIKETIIKPDWNYTKLGTVTRENYTLLTMDQMDV